MTVIGADKQGYLADFSLLFVTVIWGLSFTILKNILGHQFSPIVFILIRFTVASLVILPLCAVRLRKMDRGGLFGGLLLGALIFFGFAAQSVGIQYTTASKSAFITGLSALFVPLFLLLHRRKSPGLINGLALLAAMTGMYLLTDPAGGNLNKGDMLTLICAAIFGAQIYLMGVVVPGRDFMSITFIQLATTAVLAAIVLPAEKITFSLGSGAISAVLYLGILATAAALGVQAWAQQKTSAVKAGLIFTAEPVFAYIFASTLLGDYFDPLQKLGGAIIVLAVVSSEIAPSLLKRNRSASGT